jgi:hypothetical protein
VKGVLGPDHKGRPFATGRDERALEGVQLGRAHADVNRALGHREDVGAGVLRDIVLDPFGGSGSTLIACERTGRHARLMELDPKYVDTIILRWQEFSGGTATLDGDGRSYDAVSAIHRSVGSRSAAGGYWQPQGSG